MDEFPPGHGLACFLPPERAQSLFTLGNKSCEQLCPFETYINHHLHSEKSHACVCVLQKAFQSCKTSLFSLFPFAFPTGALVLGGVCGEKFQREALTGWDTAGGECVQWSHDQSAKDGAHHGEIHSVPGIQPRIINKIQSLLKCFIIVSGHFSIQDEIINSISLFISSRMFYEKFLSAFRMRFVFRPLIEHTISEVGGAHRKPKMYTKQLSATFLFWHLSVTEK